MRVYRLIKAKYADDPLDPQGAKLYGGRWNSKGMAAVYASDSIALAALEKLVHLHRNDVLNHFVLCEITLRDEAVMTLAGDALPKDWRDDPPPSSTAAIGDEWLASGESLALAVPSTVVPQQFNLLINSSHHGFGKLENAMIVEPFVFDRRLAK
ncbi:RES family NAD+ phosphorylase [Thiolapillus sp.]